MRREDVLPAVLRPAMYVGPRGARTDQQWIADSVVAYLDGKAARFKDPPLPPLPDGVTQFADIEADRLRPRRPYTTRRRKK